MQRSILFLALFAAGSDPLAAFPVPRAAQKPSVAGTTWGGEDTVGYTRLTFESDGRLTYSYKTTTFNDGHWKQDGTKITWAINNDYRWFEADCDGQEMKVRSENKTGFKHDFKLELQKDPTAP